MPPRHGLPFRVVSVEAKGFCAGSHTWPWREAGRRSQVVAHSGMADAGDAGSTSGARCWTDDGHLQRRPAAAPSSGRVARPPKAQEKRPKPNGAYIELQSDRHPLASPGFLSAPPQRSFSEATHARIPHTASRIPHPAAGSHACARPGQGAPFFESSRRGDETPNAGDPPGGKRGWLALQRPWLFADDLPAIAFPTVGRLPPTPAVARAPP